MLEGMVVPRGEAETHKLMIGMKAARACKLHVLTEPRCNNTDADIPSCILIKMTDLEKSFPIERPENSDSLVANGSKELLTTAADDEAAGVIANYSGPLTWAPEEEKRLRRRIDLTVMTCLCMTYFLQYYDKAMLGQAALFGLTSELKLEVGNRYSFSAAIFYLGFIAGSYPAILLAQRFPIERVASGIVTLWGVCLLLTITAFNYQGLYAQRFFLGLLEAGISPMFMMIVGSWYKKDEQAFRMG